MVQDSPLLRALQTHFYFLFSLFIFHFRGNIWRNEGEIREEGEVPID